MRAWLALLFLAFGSWCAAEEKILSFHGDIRIAADGELTVTETIAFSVEGRQIRRGILRDFPTDYRDRFGRSVAVPFELVSVRRNGSPEPALPSRKANGVSVRIGNPGVELPRGRHVYEITYRTRFQLGFFEQHDELYWNVTGNGWTFAMDEASAEVQLPRAVPAKDIRVEGYTGPFGARERNYAAEALEGGARFWTTRPLGVGHGLTIVMMFPKGVVAPPSLRQKFDRWLKDNRGEAMGLAGFLFLLAFLYWRWTAVGRDPQAGPEFPRYEAPKGLGPAAVRYLDRMAWDDRCFAAGLLGLAQRGYLHIRHHRGSYELERTGKTVEWLPGESQLATLVPATGARAIGATYDPQVSDARSGAYTAIQRKLDPLFSRNSGSTFMGIIIGVAVLVMMHVLDAALLPMIVLGVAMLIAVVLFGRILPAYTVAGRRVMDEIDGLRQYLSVAEKDGLARQKRPPRTKEEFAKFLPYAVALGVEKTWADAFAKVLGAAGLAAATSEYFSSTSRDSFDGAGGLVSAATDMGDTISSAATPPGSSSGGSSSSDSGGSSGGGSSGGGGGGGGGSGW